MNKTQILFEIHNFAKSIENPSKKGNCIRHSHQFMEMLADNKHCKVSVQFGLLNKQDHAWVEVWADDMPLTLVDFTASQFGPQFPELIMGEPKDIFEQYNYEYCILQVG